jgi:hypothetical protein
VFPITTLVVAARIDDLLAASAAERLAKSGKPARKGNRVANALSGAWSTLNRQADRPATPKLSDYPFRS